MSTSLLGPLRRMRLPAARFAIAVTSLAACNVEPVVEDGCDVELVRTPGCPAAAVVVMSDFLSSQVALVTPGGQPLCESFASSARGETSGVAPVFSGDLVVPSSPPLGDHVVLIDRYGTNVVSFLDPETGALRRQLAIGTGFESNPQDYLEVSPSRAFVTRWGENPFPSQEPHDAGGDVLVIDPEGPAIVGSIPLPRPDEFPPRPTGLVRFGAWVVVTLQRASRDVRSMGTSMLVGIDPDAESVAWSWELAGLKNCGTVALSPSGARAALACTGYIDPDGVADGLDESALVLLAVGPEGVYELQRQPAAELAGEPLQQELEFFGEEQLLVKTQTPRGGGTNNRLLALHLETGAVDELSQARPNQDGVGQGVVYGGLLCTPGCGETCLLTDADRHVLQRFAIVPGGLEPLPPVAIGTRVGLPPRDLAGF